MSRQHHGRTPMAIAEEEKYLVTVPTHTERVVPVIRVLINPAYGPEGRLEITIASLQPSE